MRLSWSHAVLYVRDQEKILDFYTNVLGFQITDRGPLAADGPEVLAWVEQEFRDAPGFAPIDEYVNQREVELAV